MGGGDDWGAGGSGYRDVRCRSGNISSHGQLYFGGTLCTGREHSLVSLEKKKIMAP